MTSGRFNSPEAIKLATEVVHAFGGSWEAVDEASERGPDGVYVIRRSAIERARRERKEAPRAA